MPYWAFRSYAQGHAWRTVPEALGLLRTPPDKTGLGSIWFHAVSVGEVLASLPFLRRLRHELPEVRILVSTGTASGRRLAEDKLRNVADLVFRAPLELPWCVRRVFSQLRPRLLILAETELWPNYLFQAERWGAATMVVNGRISDRSAPRYRALRFLFGRALREIDLVLTQSAADRQRFLDAGAPPAVTHVGGNFKYDLETSSAAERLSRDLEGFIERASPGLLLVAGSTREGEEALLAPALRSVASLRKDLLCIVAPRHPGRFSEAARALAETGLPLFRRSGLTDAPPCELPAVLLLDSLGELAAVYRRADLAFVGGSLNGWGGHNVLEPALHGCPVVVGPTMQNFRQITADLLRAGGLVQAGDPDGVGSALRELSSDARKRNSLGGTARAFAVSQRGASERALKEAVKLHHSALPRHPPRIGARLALGPLAALWSGAARLRRFAYARGLLTAERLPAPVVAVGNLSVGGTGKTPTVAWLVERLAEAGQRSAVLTRGYRRTGPSVLVSAATRDCDPHAVGDEPAMLARRFRASAPRTLLAIGANRHASGRLVLAREELDYLILDDGFQHLQLARDLNIVLVDAADPFDNGHTLPLGRLREPPPSLYAADIVLLTKTRKGFDYSRLRNEVRRHNDRAPILHARMVPAGLANLGGGDPVPLDGLVGRRVAAFCGIGRPMSFWREVHALGCDLVHRRAFRDHHRYSRRDIRSLRESAASCGAEAFLTTEKDAVKLQDLTDLGFPAFALRIKLEIKEAGTLLQQVLSLRKTARKASCP